MPSNYEGFYVLKQLPGGVIEPVGENVDVHVRAAGEIADETESPLSTDANGYIEAGALASVDVGTLVYFRVEDEGGAAGSITQITTA